MLVIDEGIYKEIVRHCDETHPREACGMVAVWRDGVRMRHVPMRNASQDPWNAFEFDPHEQLEEWGKMDLNDEVPLVFYHSHTYDTPEPSDTDKRAAWMEGAHYLIISTATKGYQDFAVAKSCELIGGELVAEEIQWLKS
jgi:proteasome lid subunit RPN8/RPN11